ncbi:preprotein translocase subunit YajC [Fusobacterium perfoetens]|uniref:preprotein translocase subunit YajC n=1 Tax=Fusobacterium perfoetens TaxID=852 RepID=UPI0015A3B12E|nr:preprotein translocase subunit YajC [Fusobacterium perfoetens]MCF2625372.1 preprotein translocase subunit YajC [Fusobacterium perfoetens]
MNEILAKYGTFIMIAVWIAIIYFFMILPNKKKQKKQKEMLDSIKEGNEIVTIGGIKGTVSSVEDDFIQIRVDKGVNLTIRKSAVAVVLK